jgi:phosphoglycerate dehydrogenase-like enzyme
MRILLWTGHARAELIARLGAIAGVELVVIDDAQALAREAASADALVCTDFVYTAEVAALLARDANRLKWIQLLTAGYDGALAYGVKPGVVLTNAGDALTPAVAMHAVALLLALQRRFPVFLANQRAHEWDRRAIPQMVAPAGSTIAIVGFGSIGREIARLLREFGARIIGLSRSAAPHPLADEVARTADLAAILPRADAIVLSLPLTAATQHLIGARELALCKRSAILVNIARGGIVDHVALAEALKNGVIAGAGIDVTEPEPLPREHPLWDAPNLILSPHLAGAVGPIGLRRLADMAGENVERFIAGKELAHRIALQ